MTATKKPLQAAREAAKQAFDAHLEANKATATFTVPQSVIDAAQAAYDAAGGNRKVKVIGHGNRTHPVCSVDVK